LQKEVAFLQNVTKKCPYVVAIFVDTTTILALLQLAHNNPIYNNVASGCATCAV